MQRISASRWRWWGLVVIGSIWILSLIPHPPSLGIESEDKAQHFIAYGTLMWWWCGLVHRLSRRAMLALACTLMGIAIEFVQGWTGWRHFDVNDMIANGIGVAIGWAFAQTPVSAALLLRVKESSAD